MAHGWVCIGVRMKGLVLRIAILVLLWAMAAAWPAEGQPALRHRFGFGIGLGHDAQKDELVSPLRYSGLLVPFHFEYSFRGRNHGHIVEVEFGASTLTSAISRGVSHTQDLYLIDVHGGYERRIDAPQPWGVWLGVETEHHYAFREHHYTPVINEYAGIYYSAVGPSFSLNRRIRTAGELGFHVAIPILAFMIRPPYSLKGSWEPDVVLLNELTGASSNIYYTYDLSRSFALRLRYGFSFYRTEIPFRLVDVQNNLGAVVLFKR
jgi:hypothetical protein